MRPRIVTGSLESAGGRRAGAPTLVLLCDGQSNVPMDPLAYSPRDALAVADRIRADGVPVLVVDVAAGTASPPALVELAERLGGRFLRVARGDAGAGAAAARSRSP